MTIESEAAQTLLQDGERIAIGGRTVKAAPVTLNTLVRVSALISEMPIPDKDAVKENAKVLYFVLANARDCGRLPMLAAMLVKGTRHWNNPLKRLRLLLLAHHLGDTLTADKLSMLIYGRLSEAHVADFFALITFLNETNLLKRKVTTTASGQQ